MSAFRTKLAAMVLLAVIGGIAALLLVSGPSDEATADDWLHEADRLCHRASDRLARMPPVHITNYGSVVPAMASNERSLARGLRALGVPKEERYSLRRLAGLFDRQASEVDAAAVAYTGKIRFAAYQRHVRQADGFNDEIEAAARSLGARACAQPPVRTRYL